VLGSRSAVLQPWLSPETRPGHIPGKFVDYMLDTHSGPYDDHNTYFIRGSLVDDTYQDVGNSSVDDKQMQWVHNCRINIGV